VQSDIAECKINQSAWKTDRLHDYRFKSNQHTPKRPDSGHALPVTSGPVSNAIKSQRIRENLNCIKKSCFNIGAMPESFVMKLSKWNLDDRRHWTMPSIPFNVMNTRSQWAGAPAEGVVVIGKKFSRVMLKTGLYLWLAPRFFSWFDLWIWTHAGQVVVTNLRKKARRWHLLSDL
jgi:hypothetical protein